MEITNITRRSVILGALFGTALFAAAQSAVERPATANKDTPIVARATLFCGTDESGFDGMNGELAIVRTSGPHILGSAQVYNLDVPVNGISFDSSFLWAGQPEDVGSVAGNTLRHISISLPPTVISTIEPGSNSFSAECCNEQMLEFKGILFHVHYGTGIQLLAIDSSGDSEVTQTYSQTDAVGIATDGVKIWISLWSNKQVGTWDPATNTFTSMFSTPSNAGGLAWDVANHVLWVGMEGGSVLPYDAAGKQLGPGFQPFGNTGSDTIDGVALVPVAGSD